METREFFSGCLAPQGEGAIAVFAAVTGEDRPGAAIRRASREMETYSPYQRIDIADIDVCDLGDIEFTAGDAGKMLDSVEALCGKLHDAGKMPVMIAAEHVPTFGAIRAAVARYPDLRVIHFGAYADLKREHRGEAISSRTTMRRVWDLLGDRRIYQFGVRSGSREEFEWGVPPHVRMEHFYVHSIDSCAEGVGSNPVYITVDMSVVDPSEFPGVRSPNAGGVSFSGLHDALMSLRGLDVVAFDICGLSPEFDDVAGSSSAMVFKLLREMLAAYL